VADETFFRDALWIAVNGYGVASLDLSSGMPVFQYFYDDMIFGHRTMTDLIPRADTLTIHLYFNEALNTTVRQRLPLSDFGLARFLATQKEFDFQIPPFQRTHPGWEPVGFFPIASADFLFEWKLSDAGGTSFAYTRYNADTGGETPISRDAYLSTLRASSNAARGSHAALLALLNEKLGSLPPDSAAHFTFRSGARPLKSVYRSAEGVSSVIAVSVFEEAGGAHALIPEGSVLEVSADGSTRAISLPALPEGFRYTDLVKVRDFLFIPWERSSFTDVGAAGALLYSLTQ
jgi:hypothetical protein